MSFDFLNKNNNKADSKKESANVEVKNDEKIKLVKVKAVMNGWYDRKRIDEGTEFIVPENMISNKWMKVIE